MGRVRLEMHPVDARSIFEPVRVETVFVVAEQVVGEQQSAVYVTLPFLARSSGRLGDWPGKYVTVAYRLLNRVQLMTSVSWLAVESELDYACWHTPQGDMCCRPRDRSPYDAVMLDVLFGWSVAEHVRRFNQ